MGVRQTLLRRRRDGFVQPVRPVLRNWLTIWSTGAGRKCPDFHLCRNCNKLSPKESDKLVNLMIRVTYKMIQLWLRRFFAINQINFFADVLCATDTQILYV